MFILCSKPSALTRHPIPFRVTHFNRMQWMRRLVHDQQQWHPFTNCAVTFIDGVDKINLKWLIIGTLQSHFVPFYCYHAWTFIDVRRKTLKRTKCMKPFEPLLLIYACLIVENMVQKLSQEALFKWRILSNSMRDACTRKRVYLKTFRYLRGNWSPIYEIYSNNFNAIILKTHSSFNLIYHIHSTHTFMVLINEMKFLTFHPNLTRNLALKEETKVNILTNISCVRLITIMYNVQSIGRRGNEII